MKKEDFIALGLDEETAQKCAKASEEELANYIPKTEYDVLKNERDAANQTIKERDKQLESLKKSTGDVESMKKEIETLQESNKLATEKHQAEIKQLKIDHAVESALHGAGAKNLKAVRALLEIDTDKIKVKEDGTLDGLNIDEQIKTLKKAEDSKFMFNEEVKRTLKGVNPASGSVENLEKVDFSTMSYTEMCTYLDQNPDAVIE